VGEPFEPGCSSWPEGTRYQFGLSGHELLICRLGIGPDLEEAVRRGPAEFALIVEPPLIVLAYRFGRVIPWSTAPFSWHMLPGDERVLPEPTERPERSLLWISAVAAEDGIIRAQRGMTLSPEFTTALHQAIVSQAEEEFDPAAYIRAIGTLYLGHPEPDELPSLALAHSVGNG
jgi:hypothetical protein